MKICKGTPHIILSRIKSSQFVLVSKIVIAVAALVLGTWVESTLAQPDVADPQPRFFVAPDGDDANAGTFEKPFATLERARDAVRILKTDATATAIPPSPIVVAVRGGTYFLNRTFVLSPEDSGTAGQLMVYSAYQQEKPVFSGGRRITHFVTNGGLWTTTLPEVAAGTWNFTCLSEPSDRTAR